MLSNAVSCRCGYASPAGAVRCFGCGRTTATALAAGPVESLPFALPSIPVAPLALVALTAAAWVGPDERRPQVLTLAALLGASMAATGNRPAGANATATPATAPDRLTDDELREALAAW